MMRGTGEQGPPRYGADGRACRALAGGAAAGLSRLPEAMLARLGEEVAQELAPCRQGDGYVAQSEVLIAVARRV